MRELARRLCLPALVLALAACSAFGGAPGRPEIIEEVTRQQFASNLDPRFCRRRIDSFAPVAGQVAIKDVVEFLARGGQPLQGGRQDALTDGLASGLSPTPRW